MEVTMRYFILAILWMMTLWSCTVEELPEPTVQGESPFDLSLTIDGTSLSTGADYYMETSYALDTAFGLWVFSGNYREVDCSPVCGPSLSIEFYDTEIREASDILIDDVIKAGQYELAFGANFNQANYTIQQDSTDILPNNFCWIDASGTESYCNEPQVQGPFFLGLVYRYDDATEILYFGSTDNSGGEDFDVQLCISYNPVTEEYLFAIEGPSPNIADVLWTNSVDGTEYVGYELRLLAGELSTELSVEIIGRSQDSLAPFVQIIISINPQTFAGNKCVSGYTIDHIPSDPSGTVMIHYTDAEGKNYTALNFVPGFENKFEISNVRSFEDNPQGYPTVIFDFEYQGLMLHDALQEVIYVEEAKGTFAVAYPN